jgi:hypothetical protein
MPCIKVYLHVYVQLVYQNYRMKRSTKIRVIAPMGLASLHILLLLLLVKATPTIMIKR